MNIFEVLDLIRKSDDPGELTQVADAIMDLYLAKKINCRTVLQMYGEIVHIMIMNASPYAHNARNKEEEVCEHTTRIKKR